MKEMTKCEYCNSEIICEYNEVEETNTYVCSYCGIEYNSESEVDEDGLQDLSAL